MEVESESGVDFGPRFAGSTNRVARGSQARQVALRTIELDCLPTVLRREESHSAQVYPSLY